MSTAPIRPLAWESPYAAGAALEKAKRQIYTCVCVCVCVCFMIDKKCYFKNIGFEIFWFLKERKEHMLYTSQLFSRVTGYVFWGEGPSKS